MRQSGRTRATRPGGFTLVELAIVILIIGLIMTFILAASYEGVQRAQIRSTQALITKLEVGVADRIEALLSQRVVPNGAHQFLATIYPQGLDTSAAGQPWGLYSDTRAEVIARLDFLKAELPDVFLVQVDPAQLPSNPTAANGQIYPLNFAAQPYPHPSGNASPRAYVLPLGHDASPPFIPKAFDPMTGVPLDGIGDSDGTAFRSGMGIYGASYSAAGGLYKRLGYLTQGYDGADNNGNGLVDEWAEGIGTDPVDPATGLSVSQTVKQRLASHKHNTARAEMLYAVLVEGRGPLGSIFNPDDFTDREVKDTDNDGLPEFIDAWGEPLQFYRWPVHYRSDVQKGGGLYNNATEPREQHPVDGNGQLVAPAWWSYFNRGRNGDQFQNGNGGFFGTTNPAAPTDIGGRAYALTNYFHPLVDYNAASASGAGLLWDRSGAYARRAYYYKFLIASSGPDRRLGLGQIGLDYTGGSYNVGLAPATPVPVTAANLILIENTASPLSPYRQNNPPFYTEDTAPGSQAINAGLAEWGVDDLTNQNLSSPGAGNQ